MNEIANPTNKNVVCLKLLGQLDLFMRKSQPASVITSKFAFLDDVALQIGSFDIEANDQVILEKDGDDGNEDEKNNNDDIDEDEALIKSILGHLLAITFRYNLNGFKIWLVSIIECRLQLLQRRHTGLCWRTRCGHCKLTGRCWVWMAT